ncbi:hypothetical protein TWF696_001636 [Orbilia brochopaga]|uniref:Methyltransferase domain-containing protein n=1 Tax=Orbilia brochopaga TaxID=3140254 RepID=A0AAV9UD75_9PEZI
MASPKSTQSLPKLAIESKAFDEMAKRYDRGLGGANLQIVQKLLERCGDECPLTAESVVHDNACGPAVVTRAILEFCTTQPSRIYATDYAQGMIDIASLHQQQADWQNVTVELMNGQNLSFDSNTFTHSISSLGVFMFPDEEKGLSEMYRTLKPGGWIGVTSWNDVRWPIAATAAYERLFPNAAEPMIFPRARNWEQPEDCERMLRVAGFKDIKTEIIQCINRQPDKEAAIDTLIGFLKNISPTAREWDDGVWKQYCDYFHEEAGLLFMPVPSGQGQVEMVMKAVITSGRKPEESA